MKTSIITTLSLFLVLASYQLTAAGLQDGSRRQKVSSNKTAKLGSAKGQSVTYHPGWRYSKSRRAYWHDKHKSNWLKTQNQKKKKSSFAR